MSKDYKIGVVIGLLILIAGVSYFVITRDRDNKDELAGDPNENKVEQVVYADGTRSENTGNTGKTGVSKTESTDNPDDSFISSDLSAGTKDSTGDIKVEKKDPPENTSKDFIDPGFGEKTGIDSTEALVSKDSTGMGVVEKDPFENLVDPVDSAGKTGESKSGGDSAFFSLDDKKKGSATGNETVEIPEVKPEVKPKKDPGNLDLSWSGDKKAAEDDEPFFGRITPRTTEATSGEETGTTETVAIESTTYEVKSGDQGFWAIAAKVYGKENAKYYWKIRDANPEVNSISLRPGRILKIPALTLKVSKKVSVAPEAGAEVKNTSSDRGKVVTDADGKRYYIVSKDDSTGFWGIAGKPEVYGNKMHYKLIRDANPQVNSNNIKIGTRLLIPPAPAPVEVPKRENTATVGSIDSGTGTEGISDEKKYYTVLKGDAGFWGISKKVYGAGKYSYMIRKANPEANPEMLRPGMKLVIPALDTETLTGGSRGSATTPPVRRSTSSAPPPTGVPDFGP